MAIVFIESPDSRELSYGSANGDHALKATAKTTANETEGAVWLAAMANSLPYRNGLIRNNIRVRPKGAPFLWDVEITYGTTGVGGGDQPLGGVDNANGAVPPPTAPADSATPLASGWSFNIEAPTLHLVQSKETVLKAARVGHSPAPDFGGAIGASRKGPDIEIEGCDVPPPAAFTFSRTMAAAVVNQAYLNTLSEIAGRPNDAPFYGWAAGEVLLKSASGQYTEAEKWSVTFTFAVEKNRTNIEILPPIPPTTIPELIVLEKRGWDHLWILYADFLDTGGKKVKQPVAAYVERVFDYADFSLLNIGA